ncbi:hypothetical protein AVEN_231776-1 [Araneus ventricosus]|uniref:Uncharacterized protein n=1 Tax=Araneus ventricosus TaxID=182803 RepID=A0A4Y2NCY4_ARAVE|nr:hypothetical protein AVEN_231776-1 [Araneus ventricosus]
MFIDNAPEDQDHPRASPVKEEYWKVIAKHPKDKQVVRLASANQEKASLRPKQLIYAAICQISQEKDSTLVYPNNTRRCTILLRYLRDIVRHSEYLTTS